MGGSDSRHWELPGRSLGLRLRNIQRQAGIFDTFARARRKHDVCVQRSVPSGEEPALDLRILCQPSLANSFLGQGELLEGGGKRVLARGAVLLVKELGAGEGGASHSMGEGLGLRLRGWGSRQGRLSLGGVCSGGEQVDFLADGSAEVVEGLLHVGWVVVGFVGVLVTDSVALSVTSFGGALASWRSALYSRNSQHLLVNLLQGIDTLLQLDVVGRELSL